LELPVSDQENVTYCATHPNVETYLRCGRCDTPICPKCLVQTPVGARCRQCAHVQKLPLFSVSPTYYARAVGAALGLALAAAAVYAMILITVPITSFLALMGIGYLIGEGVSRSVNRKRGRALQAIAGLSVLLGFVLSGSVLGLLFAGELVFVLPRVNIYALIGLAIGVLLATSRLK